MTDPDLDARARSWLLSDPDPVTRAQLGALLVGGELAQAELSDQFDTRLELGTGGLRGPLGPGPGRMNQVVVRGAMAGLLAYLATQGVEAPRVVIGHDARERSSDFAVDAARVVAAHGGRALLLPPLSPTPLLAFAVRHLGADAGFMCTASHNPAGDHGVKVYLADGAQVVPPADRAIAAAIEAVGSQVPAVAPADDPAIEHLGPEVADAYLDGAVALLPPGPRAVRVVYTPLHGVGGGLTVDAFSRAGFPSPLVVADQAEPDAAFPTTPRPNPEEPGALALAEAYARAEDADLVLAHDPDADRLGVMAPRATGWVALKGGQIGALLAEHLLSRGEGDDRLVVDTVVSSRLLGRIAAAHGVHHERTLTGFKWIVRPALAHPEWRLVLAYEDALGYAVDPAVRDKDGITAALVFAEMAAGLLAQGRTVWDELEALARRHGYHGTDAWSLRFDGLGAHRRARRVMAQLRAEPPTKVAGHAVTAFTDLAEGAGGLPATDAVVLELEDGAWLAVRPSGTEPTVKVYAEVVTPVPDGADGYEQAESTADAALTSLREAARGFLHARA